MPFKKLLEEYERCKKKSMRDRYYFSKVNDFDIERLEIKKTIFLLKGLILSNFQVGILNNHFLDAKSSEVAADLFI